MYNRYIPQKDGTWRRCRVEIPQKPPAPPCEDPPTEPPAPACAAPTPPEPPAPPGRRRPPEQPAGAFLKNLLPGDFDTGDLLVLLLLLIMAGEGREDRTTALLTLVIYLFL